jgi:hypothetical protein
VAQTYGLTLLNHEFQSMRDAIAKSCAEFVVQRGASWQVRASIRNSSVGLIKLGATWMTFEYARHKPAGHPATKTAVPAARCR